MKYGLIIFAMFLLTTCSSNTKNSNDAQLKIDIYKNESIVSFKPRPNKTAGIVPRKIKYIN